MAPKQQQKGKPPPPSINFQKTLFLISAISLAAFHFLPSYLPPSLLPLLNFRSPPFHSLPSHSGIPSSLDLLSADLGSVLEHLKNGSVTSVALVDAYIGRIERDNEKGLELRAVRELAPREGLREFARALDEERGKGLLRGRLHGVPILVKDNIATEVSLGMNTTAGSYALRILQSAQESLETLISSIYFEKKVPSYLGKTNLSEWAYYKGTNLRSGWSAIVGYTNSAYVKSGDPGGSSSGSGVAISAGWAAASIGTETGEKSLSFFMGVSFHPHRAALYGLKPTVGLVSRAGIVPISSTQDSPGPMAKSTFDVALILSVIAGVDKRDAATLAIPPETEMNYTTFLRGVEGFEGLRIGVPRQVFYNESITSNPPEISIAIEKAISQMRSLGAAIIDPAEVPSVLSSAFPGPPHPDHSYKFLKSELTVLDTDFKVDLERYLSELEWEKGVEGVRNLGEVIVFNDREREKEFTKRECCQEILVRAVQTRGQQSEEYLAARKANTEIGRTNGIDAVLKAHDLDLLLLPSEGMSTSLAAIAGYPIATVPLGYLEEDGRPFGMAFVGTAWSEGKLLRAMSAYEAGFPPRRLPPRMI